MQVKVEVLEGLKRKLTIEVQESKISEKVFTELKKAQKKVKLDGFRVGKVPMKVIKQRYSASIRHDVLSKIIDETYPKAVEQEKLDVASYPEINPTSGFKDGENLIYEATVEVFPEFEVKGLDSITIDKSVSEVSKKDIDVMLKTLQQQTATWSVSGAAKKAAKDNRVTVDFVGKIDGKEFDGGSAKDVTLVIGKKQMLPEFEEAIIGHKTKEEVTATVNFPEDYHGKDVAGKTAEFSIEIKKIETEVLPEIDEEFVKKFGTESGKKEDLETAIKKNMERELKAGIKAEISQQLMQHLIDSNQFDIPESSVNQEVFKMMQESGASEEELKKIKPEELKLIKENYKKPATDRIRLSLVMGKVLETKKIKVDEKLVDAHIKEIAETYENPAELETHYKKDKKIMSQIRSKVLEEQIVTSLLENAKIVEKKKKFSEIIKTN